MANKIRKVVKRIIKSTKKIPDLKFCPVCESKSNFNPFPYNNYFKKFYEHEFVFSPFLFETLNLKDYKCKYCKSSDRERLISLYLNNYLNYKDQGKLKLIEFAPKKPLQEFIKRKQNIIYRCADLVMEDVDDKVDITQMDIYKDETFDIFVCSHILEHIEDDALAMKELYRITKKGGVGLCLVPIMLSLDSSVENKEYLETEHLRWKYFGQYDHVRMYSKNDFVARLEKAGFTVNQYGQDFFGKEAFKSHGIDKKSVLYVVKK